MRKLQAILSLGLLALGVIRGAAGEASLLNVSYDPTRELYQEINAAFAQVWQKKTGERLVVRQSHGGSGKQARAVLDGLEADVVTLALAYDIDALAIRGRLLPTNWQSRLPHNSAPFVSTVVFLVRRGNPKEIGDWDDLTRRGIKVITPNPKTSGGARWNYLAAYGYELKRTGGDHLRAQAFVERLFRNVPMLDTGARGAMTTFLQRGFGDVLIAWENEALLAERRLAPGRCEIVRPSASIVAEPPVAWVDRYTERHGTTALAREYLMFLYTEAGQETGARNFYRPTLKSVAAKHGDLFPEMPLFTVNELFGSWAAAHAQHFAEGGLFDRMYEHFR